MGFMPIHTFTMMLIRLSRERFQVGQAPESPDAHRGVQWVGLGAAHAAGKSVGAERLW